MPGVAEISWFPFLSVFEGILEVLEVNLFHREGEINKREHHTDKYNNHQLLVRRGQSFHVQISFGRPYIPGKDQFWIEYLIGKCLTGYCYYCYCCCYVRKYGKSSFIRVVAESNTTWMFNVCHQGKTTQQQIFN